MKSLSHVRFLATPWIAAYQAPPSMGFFQTRVLELGAIAVSNFNYQSRSFPSVQNYLKIKRVFLKVLNPGP